MSEDELTPEEMQILLANAATVPEEKLTAHSFLKKVVEAKDTTRVGYLREEEVGIPKLSVRTLQELALFCGDIADEPLWAKYFMDRSQILTSTSLSKNAKLIELAVVQRREVADVTPEKQPMKENRGWFKSKKQNSNIPAGV